MFTPDLRDLANSSVLLWLATLTPEGAPSLSPKEIWQLLPDDSLIIADILSPGSRRNLRADPRASAVFLDIFRQAGFRLSGRARVVARDEEEFATLGAALLGMAEPKFRVSALIHLVPERVEPILAPSYRLFPETTEAAQIASAHQTYGTRPRD